MTARTAAAIEQYKFLAIIPANERTTSRYAVDQALCTLAEGSKNRALLDAVYANLDAVFDFGAKPATEPNPIEKLAERCSGIALRRNPTIEPERYWSLTLTGKDGDFVTLNGGPIFSTVRIQAARSTSPEFGILRNIIGTKRIELGWLSCNVTMH